MPRPCANFRAMSELALNPVTLFFMNPTKASIVILYTCKHYNIQINWSMSIRCDSGTSTVAFVEKERSHPYRERRAFRALRNLSHEKIRRKCISINICFLRRSDHETEGQKKVFVDVRASVLPRTPSLFKPLSKFHITILDLEFWSETISICQRNWGKTCDCFSASYAECESTGYGTSMLLGMSVTKFLTIILFELQLRILVQLAVQPEDFPENKAVRLIGDLFQPETLVETEEVVQNLFQSSQSLL